MTIYLYVKTHKNGLKYFGKTTNLDPHNYKGSGLYWNNYCKKYGYEYSTEIVATFENNDREKALQFAINYSKEHDIVASKEWANLKEERLDGGFDHINNDQQTKKSCIEKTKQTLLSWSEEKRKEIQSKKTRFGSDNGMFGRNRSGSNNPRYGVELSEDTKLKISRSNKGKIRSAKDREKMANIQTKRWMNMDLRKQRSDEWKLKGIKPPSCKGLLWWNDGTTEKRSAEIPGCGWKRGRIKIS
jgi:hypothetical protein